VGGAEDDEASGKTTVQAPPDTARLTGGLGGAYYADQNLVRRFTELKSRLQSIKRSIEAGVPSSESALRELADIERESNEIRQTIDSTKTFVAAFQAYKKTEQINIPLAESGRIIMRGDSVTMKGWEGPGIKVVLEKVILAKQEPDASEFDAIKVVHDVRIAESLVGKTAEQRASDEQSFRESDKGRQMTEEQLGEREAFVRKLFSGYEQFRDFQGIAANVLSVSGLRHENGNRQLSYRINSPGGGGSLTSTWKRHANVTVYVPPCKHILVAGCLVELDIADVNANLMLSTRESRDRDYDGTFFVRSIDGDVTIDQAPVRVLDGVSGNVRCVVTDEFVNSGTRHSGGFRTAYSYAPSEMSISNVQGTLQATLLRTDLQLSNILGIVDVMNEYGSTHWTVSDDLSIHQAMRIVSQSGRITLSGPRSVLESLPLYAHTQCGKMKTDLSRETLDDVDFTTGTPQRNWTGFVTPSDDRYALAKFERPTKAIHNEDRSAGIDLISHAGSIEILSTSD
jgi:hypothetical protein